MTYVTKTKLEGLVATCRRHGSPVALESKGKTYRVTCAGRPATGWLFPGELAPWLNGHLTAIDLLSRRRR